MHLHGDQRDQLDVVGPIWALCHSLGGCMKPSGDRMNPNGVVLPRMNPRGYRGAHLGVEEARSEVR